MKLRWRECIIITLAVILILILISTAVFGTLRSRTVLPSCGAEISDARGYSGEEKVIIAVSLSYLTYGCETAECAEGTVSDLLARKNMGIIEENFGIKRADKSDPSTAVFDTSEFIEIAVGKTRGISAEYTDNCRINNYLTSPSNGRLSYMDAVQRLIFSGKKGIVKEHIFRQNDYMSDAHTAFPFIEFRDGDYSKPVLPYEIG